MVVHRQHSRDVLSLWRTQLDKEEDDGDNDAYITAFQTIQQEVDKMLQHSQYNSNNISNKTSSKMSNNFHRKDNQKSTTRRFNSINSSNLSSSKPIINRFYSNSSNFNKRSISNILIAKSKHQHNIYNINSTTTTTTINSNDNHLRRKLSLSEYRQQQQNKFIASIQTILRSRLLSGQYTSLNPLLPAQIKMVEGGDNLNYRPNWFEWFANMSHTDIYCMNHISKARCNSYGRVNIQKNLVNRFDLNTYEKKYMYCTHPILQPLLYGWFPFSYLPICPKMEMLL